MSDGEWQRARAALLRWRDERPWMRRHPDQLAVAEVVPCGPVQAVLESVYEARGVQYTLESAPGPPATREDGPDPWAVPLEHEPDAPVGMLLGTPIGDTVRMTCELCSGTGHSTCDRCDGKGSVREGPRGGLILCPTCDGEGENLCTYCEATGGLRGHPTVWSELRQQREVRVHEPQQLPLNVFLELQNAEHGGELIYEEEAERIVDLKVGVGYRDPANVDNPLRTLVQQIAKAHGVPEGARIVRQRLEIRRVPAWEVRLADGRRVWVYGDPPQVEPARALETTAAVATRFAPLITVGLGAIAWAVWAYAL